MKKPFEAEMDDTRQAVGQIVGLCTTIALHQEFGVGKTRLERIKARIAGWLDTFLPTTESRW